jgi:type VI secretion system protein ImpL
MVQGIAAEFEGNVTGATVAGLAQGLTESVTRECQTITAGRYPFARSEREVPLADFARLFAPGGVMDRFFAQNLAARADRSRAQWTWRPEDPVARSFSLATLREFQRATEIRDAFFPGGGTMPAIALTVTPVRLGGDVARARLEVNGSAVETTPGVVAPATIAWPGASGLGRAVVTVEGQANAATLVPSGLFGFGRPIAPAESPIGTNITTLERSGAWALHRLLDAGSLLRQGDALVATFSVGGREVAFRFNAGSIANPLTLAALREFRCPTGL